MLAMRPHGRRFRAAQLRAALARISSRSPMLAMRPHERRSRAAQLRTALALDLVAEPDASDAPTRASASSPRNPRDHAGAGLVAGAVLTRRHMGLGLVAEFDARDRARADSSRSDESDAPTRAPRNPGTALARVSSRSAILARRHMGLGLVAEFDARDRARADSSRSDESDAPTRVLVSSRNTMLMRPHGVGLVAEHDASNAPTRAPLRRSATPGPRWRGSRRGARC
jgi:hypothetical protein